MNILPLVSFVCETRNSTSLIRNIKVNTAVKGNFDLGVMCFIFFSSLLFVVLGDRESPNVYLSILSYLIIFCSFSLLLQRKRTKRKEPFS